jgi:hypothetical protein
VVERAKNILSRSIVAGKEPEVLNAQGSEGSASFENAQLAERRAGLVAHVVAAAIAAGAINESHAFLLVERDAGKITADEHIVVRMGNDDQHIGFVTVIGRQQRRSQG